MDYVVANWMRPDMSIWEVRGNQQHFLFSQIMCWVAIDRGLRLSDKRSLPLPQRSVWLSVRDEIYERIMNEGYDPKRECFLQSFESVELSKLGKSNGVLDSSVLIMPLIFFISPTDNRFLSTLKEIMKRPEKGGLMTNNLV